MGSIHPGMYPRVQGGTPRRNLRGRLALAVLVLSIAAAAVVAAVCAMLVELLRIVVPTAP